jgi:hypothetical protein
VRLIFTKRAGKCDDLLIERDDASTEFIPCPKQGIIPHDMVHYAVEKIMLRRGFLVRIAAGETARFRMGFEDDAEAIERLVETMQAELWSGRVSAAEALAVYRHACAARSHACFPVSEEDVQLIRHEVDALTAAWDAVPLHGSLTLSLNQAV